MAVMEERRDLAALPSSHTATIHFTPPARPGPQRNAGLEIALNNINTALARLAAAPGGDLRGMRPTLVTRITTAARTLVEAMVKANEEFERTRGARTSAPAP